MDGNDKVKWQEWVTHLMAVAVGIMQEKRDLTLEEYERAEHSGDCEPMLSFLEDALESDETAERLIKAIYEIAYEGIEARRQRQQ